MCRLCRPYNGATRWNPHVAGKWSQNRCVRDWSWGVESIRPGSFSPRRGRRPLAGRVGEDVSRLGPTAAPISPSIDRWLSQNTGRFDFGAKSIAKNQKTPVLKSYTVISTLVTDSLALLRIRRSGQRSPVSFFDRHGVHVSVSMFRCPCFVGWRSSQPVAGVFVNHRIECRGGAVVSYFGLLTEE